MCGCLGERVFQSKAISISNNIDHIRGIKATSFQQLIKKQNHINLKQGIHKIISNPLRGLITKIHKNLLGELKRRQGLLSNLINLYD